MATTDGYSSGPKAEEARRSDDTAIANEMKAEKAEHGESNVQYSKSDDPFGDESNSEVKYKVLEWW